MDLLAYTTKHSTMASIKTILGFIAGASLGAIAGILLAPDSGEATRKKILDKSGDIKDSIKDTVSGLVGKGQKDSNQQASQLGQYSAPATNNDVTQF